MGCPKFTPKTVPSPSTITTPFNTPIIQLTPLTIPNGIRIHSAVLPQYTFRQTHRRTHTDRQILLSRAVACMSTERTMPTAAICVANCDRLQRLAAAGDIAGCGGHFACFYCTFRVNPHFDLEPDYITRKSILDIIQRYILRREILPTFHTSRSSISRLP